VVKYSEAPDDQTKANLDYIGLRWKQLNDLEDKRTDTTLNYLFLVSGGAAAATLTYIGNLTKDGTSVPPSAFWMLGLFSIALILVGVLKICMTYYALGVFTGWRAIVRSYYADQITWSDAIKSDEKGVDRYLWVIHTLIVVSFLSITAGVAVGFFNLQEESSRVRTEKAASSTAQTSDKASTSTANSNQGFSDGRSQPAQGSQRSTELPAAASAKKEVIQIKE